VAELFRREVDADGGSDAFPGGTDRSLSAAAAAEFDEVDRVAFGEDLGLPAVIDSAFGRGEYTGGSPPSSVSTFHIAWWSSLQASHSARFSASYAGIPQRVGGPPKLYRVFVMS